MRLPSSSALSSVLGLLVAFPCEISSAQERAIPEEPSPRPQAAGRFSYFVEGGASIFNSNAGFIRAKAGNVGATYRVGRFHVGASTGFNFWRASLYREEAYEHVGVWNIGPYAEYRFAEGRARSALLVGASVVVDPSSVDKGPGAPGFFVDARPLGLRFPVGRLHVVGLDPLSMAIRSPDTRAIPLVEIQFMTWLRWEMNP